ncbi:hypothetical protein Cme02nite_34800 [Catellatospora methionotrophica]|uniref:DUF4360 domain-containing protein n=1 Tax=Catellatospora methionotrophica TaxID=121620 RepID=A0A8J3LBJ3_9ACTN|nr:DUF4360 domain-containing protein [Catellatospora methionotrophica]GIG15148.1 hypothetical protein Cme02nite_34800 [Catellatospora methionotrophica]
MRPYRLLLACTAIVLATTAVPGTAHATGPDPDTVYIAGIAYGGTGCPNGSVASSFSNDRTSATLIFDQFVASTGPGVPVTERRKNCQINLNLHIPRSLAWLAAVKVDHRGYVGVPAGITASRGDVFHSTDLVLGAPAKTSYPGPVNKDYLVRDSYLQAPLSSTLCASETVRPDTINSQVSLDGSGGSGQITLDSLDLHVATTQLLPCPS